MSSINPKEIDQFAKDSAHWWEEDGAFGILHRLNPVRMEYILSQTVDVKGQHVLDVGCGGGLVCEPLARLGANVTGLDADGNAIDAAKHHASQMGLDIRYIQEAVENHHDQYDVVLALEILEHVTDPQTFLTSCVACLKPGGLLITSTLNRTMQSLAFGIVGAEYVLGLVPRGTHTWRQFIKPSELSRMMRNANIAPSDTTGLVMNPLDQTFYLSNNNLAINYFMSGQFL